MPGDTIYTCPRCGGARQDGVKCLACERSAYPDKRYAHQRFDWDPDSCPCCGSSDFTAEDEHGTKDVACSRCGLPMHEFIKFMQPRFPHSSINLHIETSAPNSEHMQRFREMMTGKKTVKSYMHQTPSATEHAWLRGNADQMGRR